MPSRVHGERVWRRIRERDHTLQDGRNIRLADWESTCVICGERFQVATLASVDAIEKSSRFLMVTCPRHRLTPSEVSRLRRARGRRRVFESIKRQKLKRAALAQTKE